ncbi:MAG TPA: adenylate/guanylate cyclase domain-containing protein [Terriglobales bacterium]|jgi:adenylate cyclase|nr:adenylate/guanylate cyclase domain-containing protein [Terriglobales bacterium]
MAEMALSPGVKLAWRVAGDLAFQEKDPFIEPRHLFFGIFSIGKLVSAAEKGQKKDDLVVGVKPEAERLDELAGRHSLDIVSTRRAVRRASAARAPRSSAALPRGQALSRSDASRRIFEEAATQSSSILDVPSLLRALLQAHDAEIEEATVAMRAGLAAILRELQPVESLTQLVSMSLDPRLTDLDTAVSQEFREVVQVTEAVDTKIAIQAYQALDPIKRLTVLSELTWEFGTQGLLEPMLQKAVEQLLRLVSTGERCAILVNDATGSELLLKAHGPMGTVPMISMTSAKRAISEQKGFIWNRGKEPESKKQSKIESGMYVPLVINGQAIGVICIDCSCGQQSFGRDDLLLVTSLAHQLALAIANQQLQLTLKQNSEVLERLLTNFSPKVRTRLLQRAQMGRLRLGGEQSVVSVLCADIRGFTKLTAGMPTDDVVSLLNEYFAALTECIFRHDGTIDKFVGDAILAVFGSPEADPQHCRKAVVAGMEMQEAAREVSKRRKAKSEVSCEIGIGIHTGQVLHGFIGSPERMEFTIIGEAVNRTSRYCDGAKGSEVLISPEIYERLWNAVEVQQVSIPTKHEGDFVAYRVQRVRDPGERTIVSS